MEHRTNLIITAIVKKFRKFHTIYEKIPLDIDLFANKIADLIRDFSLNLIDVYETHSLYYNEPDSDESEEESIDGELEHDDKYDAKRDESINRDARRSLIMKYGWDKMEHIYDEVVKTSAGRVAKRLHMETSKVESIVRAVKKCSNQRFRMSVLKCRLLEKFESMDELNFNIQITDIRRWALGIAGELGLPKFKCSNTFIKQFKTTNKISQRKVTCFTTKTKLDNQQELVEEAEKFNQKINGLLSNYSIVLNSDQSRFEYEMFYKRTYTKKGKKKVTRVVNNLTKTTHSYTIQPTISMDGQVSPRMVIVLQEPNGQFGCEVINDIKLISKKYKNLIILPSKSGKMTKKHVKVWFDHIIKPYENEHTVLLLLDDWGGQSEKEFAADELMEDDISDGWLSVEIIPAGTTGIAQPCDVYFFGPYKKLARGIENELTRKRIQNSAKGFPQPHERDFIARMHSLLLQQFNAPVYQPLIQGAWRLAGYFDNNYEERDARERFAGVAQIHFNLKKKNCEEPGCNNPIFIRCAHCRLEICFDCFLFTDTLRHHHFEEELESVEIDYVSLGWVAERQKSNGKQQTKETNRKKIIRKKIIRKKRNQKKSTRKKTNQACSN